MRKIKISSKEKDKMDMDRMEKLIVEAAKKLNEGNKKQGWWAQLMDKDNNKVSVSSFYLISVTLVGLLLLLVPLFVLVIEAWSNHTIMTDLNGMAAYIASVAGLFATGGIVKGWISYNDSRNRVAELNRDNNYYIEENITEENNGNADEETVNDNTDYRD